MSLSVFGRTAGFCSVKESVNEVFWKIAVTNCFHIGGRKMKKTSITWNKETRSLTLIKLKIVKLMSNLAGYIPHRSKPVLKHITGRIYEIAYSSIKQEILVKTPLGPYIYVNYCDHVEREIANGTYEKKYVNFFCSKVKKGFVVVDVGTYIGYFSLLASERVGDKSCVYAFEPVPRNYTRLLRNLRANHAKNVKAYNFGLSDKNETLPFFIPKRNPAESSYLQSSATEIVKGIKVEKDSAEVLLKSFDQFCMEQGLIKVDVIKMDAEGAEMKILKGMANTLKSNDLLLFMEISRHLVEHAGCTVAELVRFLVNCGFRSIYSVESGLETNVNVNNINETVESIKDGGGYVLGKKGLYQRSLR